MAKRSGKSRARPSPPTTESVATTGASAGPSRPDPRSTKSAPVRQPGIPALVAPSWIVAIIAGLFLASALQVFQTLNGGEAVQRVRRAAVSESTAASAAAGPTPTAMSTNLPASSSSSSPATTGASSTASGSATTTSSATNNTDTSTPTIDPDGLVVDPRTPMGAAVFLTPYTYTNVQDMTILSLEAPMPIKWAYKDVLIPPKLITIQILPPLAANQKVIGAGVKTPEQRWKNVVVNMTGSATAYNWTIDQPAGQQYKLRLFDSDLGPTPANAPGRLGTSTSSMFALYQPGGPVTLVDVFAGARVGVSKGVGMAVAVVAAAVGVQLVL
ncbi:hypothetical protein AMAG_11575 [Allomyces macrogynus ATCC 38327]|uniref:DUF7137 domain-containing protein n=1 Tax=Allomyces macrogynus (strain ATCC 38327) TaxID=578462 RepID=A0A0L0SV94_ALLM3|nr:hypothetical protein AMAG_11575 [Allomyces macrogynus ATCC 38327]|eukprot:KNE66437.1 hypothetical protein AMAG_11575 [Allomyces macrogynus ATCC 38327]